MSGRFNLRSANEVTAALRVANEPDPEDDTSEAENLSVAESDVETEQSESESEEIEPPASKRKRAESSAGRRKSIIEGKDGHRWFTASRERVMNRNNNITSFLPSPMGAAKNAQSPFESWSLLFTDEILDIIVLHTNEAIASYCENSEVDQRNFHKETDICELRAFIGLLYLSGLQKNNAANLEDLWSMDFGNALYRSTMPLIRFNFLYKCLRFDDKMTREVRRENDKFAPIREIWEKFLSRCTALYRPASYCTIDEQLLSFRGRCPFKVYNGSKPDKYGIKIVMMNDSRTSYMYTAIPYVEKVVTENGEKVPTYYVRQLTTPIYGTTRNVTCDNWFSSIPLFDMMLADYNITMVGTLRKNKREIPPDFRRGGAPLTCKYAFDATKTLLAYTPRKNKVVIMLSTFHRTDGFDDDTQKPEIISFYNSTKGGTATFDQMCHEYTTARKTRRWPARVFFGMLDQCGINAAILYNLNSAHEVLTRRAFLKSLIHDLIRPHLQKRRQIPTLRRSIVLSINQILGTPDNVHTEKLPGKLARCNFCPRSMDRKTRIRCATCKVPICEDHREIKCNECMMHD